jgi:DNA-binding transcriptional MerR regulator
LAARDRVGHRPIHDGNTECVGVVNGREGTKTNLYVNGKVELEYLAMSHSTPRAEPRLLRIQEAAAELGLTARSIRYYEEIGLLKPAARSEGAYRLFDADDVERLRFIKGLRDDAGFSLSEIAALLEDEVARSRNREAFRATDDPAERRAILDDATARVDRQIETLRAKIERLEAMIGEAQTRKAHLQNHRRELEAGLEPSHPAARR